ncbi:MAG: polyphosphate kinase 1, partial [Bacteroidota bacterium]|nr:polyphosphate kinase 1 [Bacteroidota bacterium]
VQKPSPDGRTPGEQLRMSREAVLEMARVLSETWESDLKAELNEQAGIRVMQWDDCTSAQQNWLKEYFRSNIFPVLTPLAVDPGHPFPFISNLSLSLAVTLKHPGRKTEHFARIKVPTAGQRWIQLCDGSGWIPVEQIIAHNATELFRGMKVVGVHPFRITRNADLKRDEEVADDLIEMISEELQERRFAPIVRLEVTPDMPIEVRELLARELSLEADDIYEVHGDLDLVSVSQFANLDFPEQKHAPWDPVTPQRLLHEGEVKDRLNIFEILKKGDLLVHHPYESFAGTVLRFIEEAAADPDVLAIKQTLYRTSDESPVVKALLRAAEAGKQVAVLVEVKARFDEQNNIVWGQMLEQHGVHVTYGLVGLKTHCKTTLVVRREGTDLQTYCHIGTGNYHPSTAKLYTDLGLLTRSSRTGDDLVNLFHYLTGYAPEQHYQKLIVAPRDMRQFFLDRIQDEIVNQQEHGNGRIIAKMNALDDLTIINELYRASQAGVQIDLLVRGHCRLRPGLPGFSENIRVVSIIGQFLEHSRIYSFGNNGNPRFFIGSADWQRRNLDDRVEVIVEIRKKHIRARLQRILDFSLADQSSAWELDSEGIYRLRSQVDKDHIYGTHQLFMDRAEKRTVSADPPWDM